MKPLKIIFVDYGLGKYYTYTDKGGHRHPIIELNQDMLKYDYELFFWVFRHELDHYHFYQKEENRGKKNSFVKEVSRLLSNPKMFKKLYKFERNYIKSNIKDYAMLNENLEGYKMISIVTVEDVEAVGKELQIIAGKIAEMDKAFGDEVENIKKELKEIKGKLTSNK